MLRLAKVNRRGLKSSGSGVENRAGRRSAVVQTFDGKRWHISDKTYCDAYRGSDPVPILSRNRVGPFPSVRRDQLVIIDTAKTRTDHGINPEPWRWTVASAYRRTLEECLAASTVVSNAAMPGVMTLISNYLRDDFGPASREEWLEFERRKFGLARQGVPPNYLEFIKSYFLLGHDLCIALGVRDLPAPS